MIAVDEAKRADGGRATGSDRENQIKETRTVAGRARRKAEAEYRSHRDRTLALEAEHARRAAIDQDWAANMHSVRGPKVTRLDDELRELYLTAATLPDDAVDDLFREIAAQDRRVAVVRYRLDKGRDLKAAMAAEADRLAQIEKIPDPVQREIFRTIATISEDELNELWRDIAWRVTLLRDRLDHDVVYAAAERRRRERINADERMDPRLKALYLDTTILDQADMMGAFDIAVQTVWKWRAPIHDKRRVQPHPRVSPLADVTLGRVYGKDIPGAQYGKLVEWLVETHRFLWDSPTGQIIRNPNAPRHGRTPARP